MSRNPKFVAFVADLTLREPATNPLASKLSRCASDLEVRAAQMEGLMASCREAKMDRHARRLEFHIGELLRHASILREQAANI